VKKLDFSGMKYTNGTLRLAALFRATFLCVATFCVATFCVAPSRAQSYAPGAPSLSAYNAGGGPTENSDDPQGSLITLHARVNEVNVLFIATDKHGKFVRDLNQADFSILDDHKPPQVILNFRRETDLPLHLGLLVDVSGSVDGRFDFEQNAATSFLEHTVRTGFDEAFVVGFNSHSQMAQDYTDDVQVALRRSAQVA
jgi:Ca-activated chloride channel homolog